MRAVFDLPYDAERLEVEGADYNIVQNNGEFYESDTASRLQALELLVLWSLICLPPWSHPLSYHLLTSPLPQAP